jgi:YggT family protein
MLLSVLTLAIFIRAILSWFSADRSSPVIQALDSITEPIIDPIRRIMPRIGMIDFSPLVAIILLQVVSRGLQMLLIDSGI